jgi:hypothetical protein
LIPCIDCGSPRVAEGRCAECLAEIAESPAWQKPCEACGRSMPPKRSNGRATRLWCSAACQLWAKSHPGERRDSDWLPNGRARRHPRPCARCGENFTPYDDRLKYCARKCAHAARSEHYAAFRPTACRTDDCGNAPRNGSPWCRACEEIKWPRDVEKARARSRRHTHLRKALTRRFDLPVQEERRMRAAANRCPLCRVRLIDWPYQPASKELDHIVPLNVGDAHSIFNVRIICRSCNLRRPKDGSDVLAVPLFASEVA